MRVIILSGGKGVRLAPLTQVIPKPLVPIGGMPILEVVIRQLKAQGFEKITLAVGYMAELIKAYFQDGSRFGVKIDYSFETEPLGTAGPLALIDRLDDTFMVMNADVLTNINYQEFVKHHRDQKGLTTIATFEKQTKIDLGVIVKNGDGRVKDYIEKPSYSHLVSMGIYIFEPKVLDLIQKRVYLDFPDLVRLLLRGDKPVHYYHFSGYWLDIGRHDDYAKAAEDFEILKKEMDLHWEEPSAENSQFNLGVNYA
ncbi:MAG: sugar phosphate nucleotidyltransferase [Deltaproteobacteria bacterium]|nr:sugar phosphate nucleotidyltransferase [Deltaproteobacteria bacterium]